LFVGRRIGSRAPQVKVVGHRVVRHGLERLLLMQTFIWVMY
jgi:hypothetical protein